MKKVLAAVCVFASVFFFFQAFAAPWGIVANSPDINNPASTTSIHTIDLGRTPPRVYGPFLEGQLTAPENTGDYAFDVVVLPNQRYALISVFGERKVHKVDLANPKNPVLKGTVVLDDGVTSMFAEDIAVTTDGRLALVSDGGFSPTLAFVDVKTFTLTAIFDLGAMSAQAVAIAPDNKTVLLADYFGGKVHYGTINAPKDGLENLNTIWLCDGEVVADTCIGNLALPLNIAISPDGKTALVAASASSFYDPLFTFTFYATDLVNVLEIRGPGDVVPGTPFFLHGLPGAISASGGGGQQSIQFRNNKKAYVVSQRTGGETNQLSLIQILGPGCAAVKDPGMVDLLGVASSQLFGVDVLGIAGTKALVGHASPSDDPANPNFNSVAYVDLSTGTMTPVPLKISAQPFGIAIKLW